MACHPDPYLLKSNFRAFLLISTVSAGCYSNLKLRLTSQVSNAGWNKLGGGFLDIFTLDRLTDEHWEKIGKIYDSRLRNYEDYGLIKDIAMTMDGLLFLVVFSFLLLLLFCAAPISFCVLSCTCKKKYKPRSNPLITYSGIACNSVAILSISISIIFCYLSIDSLTSGIALVGVSVKPLPDLVIFEATRFKDELEACGRNSLVAAHQSVQDLVPTLSPKILHQVMEIEQMNDTLDFDFVNTRAKMDEFAEKSDAWAEKLTSALSSNPFFVDFPRARQIVADATSEMRKIKSELNSTEGFTDRLDDGENITRSAYMNETEKLIRKSIQKLVNTVNIDHIQKAMDLKIDSVFKKQIVRVRRIISSVIENIEKKVDIAKGYLGYMQAVNIVLFPCYLALFSAIWSTSKGADLAHRKRVKPRERSVFFIPLTIGLSLASAPLLASTTFMALSFATNIVCDSVFKDESFAFLPNAFAAFNIKSSYDVGLGIKFNIISVIEECRANNTLIAALDIDLLLDEKIFRHFNIRTAKEKVKPYVDEILNGTFIPSEETRAGVEGEITKVERRIEQGTNQTRELKKCELNTEDVEDVKQNCEVEIATRKRLKESELKQKIMEIIIGNATQTPPTSGLLQEIFDKLLNDHFLTFKAELFENSTNCDFIFTLFDSVGEVFCDQALGGLNGAYAAIGLAVLSFFSATSGTVLIWHSIRAGKGQEVEEEWDDSSGTTEPS